MKVQRNRYIGPIPRRSLSDRLRARQLRLSAIAELEKIQILCARNESLTAIWESAEAAIQKITGRH